MPGFVKTFRDLDVYQDALMLAVRIHEFCKALPREEIFVLASQMRRASRSVHANISEAWRKRRYQAAFVSKLSDAETEATEMQNWFDFALKAGYMDHALYDELDVAYESILCRVVSMMDNAENWCKLKSPPYPDTP